MARRLGEFLDESSQRPFAWGSFDCILFLADWPVDQLGTDPARVYRGAYRNPLGAERIIRKAGGLVALVDREFTAVGWGKSDDLGPGDIGVIEVETATGRSACGAIFTGSHWCALAERGLLFVTCPPLASWRPACLRR